VGLFIDSLLLKEKSVEVHCIIMINQVYYEDFVTRKLYFNVKSSSATLASTNP
jgi:hypothetical protein